ncbi:hypothetical protein DL93DRAFT_2055636 [Clavulina sp. PMI_390]|nr:hypothetical protein DL93DRAFT_2055636 [Clavulina sp. PMI_390]
MAESSLALTRTTGGQAKPVPEVPAFLNKLYQMIDEPTTDDIIHWADDGESFYILSQDELQRNVLPHWFKHNKFTSFVRQLNMYGFHKMQQMKQGALKNAADEEVWQFHEPNFRRGRLDLLKLITRKKTAGGGGGMNATFNSSSNGNNTSGTAAALARSTSGRSAAELSNISEQLQLIKRSQSNILSDLKTLQLSNNQLWKEMMANQAMQKKQQDTIDRIIKFLSGVFGNHRAQQAHAHAGRGGADDVRSGTQSPSPRLSGRPLLIANGATSPGKALIRRQNSNPLPPVDDRAFLSYFTVYCPI